MVSRTTVLTLALLIVACCFSNTAAEAYYVGNAFGGYGYGFPVYGAYGYGGLGYYGNAYYPWRKKRDTRQPEGTSLADQNNPKFGRFFK
uniref:Uncharacterized protein n=1 Tax=Romanomermis culicivorax TaxID=13658 RepID=A0A915IWI5_ROMCU